MREQIFRHFQSKAGLDSVSFIIYKSGIEETKLAMIKTEIERIEQENSDQQTWSESIRYVRELYSDYWSNYFQEASKSFINMLAANYQLDLDEIEHLFADYNGVFIEQVYRLQYYFEQKGNEGVIFHFHIKREADNVLQHMRAHHNKLLDIGNNVADNAYAGQVESGNGTDKEKDNTKSGYDHKLEEIKLFIVNCWASILQSNFKCYWLEDTQSAALSSTLYPRIHAIENKLRTLILNVLIRNKGYDWDTDIRDSIIAHKANKSKSYNSEADRFKHIDSLMLSLDMRDLAKVLKHEVKDFKLEDKADKIMLQLGAIQHSTNLNECMKRINKLQDLIGKNDTIIKSSYWKDYFRHLFDVVHYNNAMNDQEAVYGSDFLKNWNKLADLRNVIAHNKLIDYQFFMELNQLIDQLDRQIANAEHQFFNDKDHDRDRDEYWSDDFYSSYENSYKNKYEREYEVYCEVADFVADAVEAVKQGAAVTVSNPDDVAFSTIQRTIENFSQYYESRNESFEKYIEFVVKHSSFILLDIRDDSQVATIFKLTQNKANSGNALTSYILEVYWDDKCIESIEIGCSTTAFVCDGVDEADEFLGGSWSSFKSRITGMLTDKYVDKKMIYVEKGVGTMFYFST